MAVKVNLRSEIDRFGLMARVGAWQQDLRRGRLHVPAGLSPHPSPFTLNPQPPPTPLYLTPHTPKPQTPTPEFFTVT